MMFNWLKNRKREKCAQEGHKEYELPFTGLCKSEIPMLYVATSVKGRVKWCKRCGEKLDVMIDSKEQLKNCQITMSSDMYNQMMNQGFVETTR